MSSDSVKVSVTISPRPAERVFLRCATCGLPWAEIQNGSLIVKSRHRGATHVNAISAVDLLAALCEPAELNVILGALYPGGNGQEDQENGR